MLVEQSLVPGSFLQGSYVLSSEVIPLSACFPAAPMLPSKATCGRSRGMPCAWDPLTSCGCR